MFFFQAAQQIQFSPTNVFFFQAAQKQISMRAKTKVWPDFDVNKTKATIGRSLVFFSMIFFGDIAHNIFFVNLILFGNTSYKYELGWFVNNFQDNLSMANVTSASASQNTATEGSNFVQQKRVASYKVFIFPDCVQTTIGGYVKWVSKYRFTTNINKIGE